MFKSRAVAKVNPSNSCNIVLILGIGNGLLTSQLFTSLKLLMKRTVLFFLGIMKEGEAHYDAGRNSNTPSSHSLFNFFIVVSFRDFGMTTLSYQRGEWGKHATSSCPKILIVLDHAQKATEVFD